jgi:hypothetical protein
MPPWPTRQGDLPPIDFAAIVARAGDLRDFIENDLGPPDRNRKHCCPFHGGGDERTPSLYVYHDHFHCYGCGEHGNVLDWVMKRHDISVVEAARRLGWVGDADLGSRASRRPSQASSPVSSPDPTRMMPSEAPGGPATRPPEAKPPRIWTSSGRPR